MRLSVQPELRHTIRIDRYRSDGLDASIDDFGDHQEVRIQDSISDFGIGVADQGGSFVADHDVFDFGVDASRSKVADFCKVFEDVVNALDVALPRACTLDMPHDIGSP